MSSLLIKQLTFLNPFQMPIKVDAGKLCVFEKVFIKKILLLLFYYRVPIE